MQMTLKHFISAPHVRTALPFVLPLPFY